jgi:hypothetical protein
MDLVSTFIPTVEQIAQVTTARLNQPYQIGSIVIPHNVSRYEFCTILKLLQNYTDPNFKQETPPPVNDYGSPPIITVGRASLLGYNLTNPNDFSARGHDRIYWPVLSSASRFKDDDDFFLLVNFEPNFLELSFAFVNWVDDECPSAKPAFPDLEENSLFNSDPLIFYCVWRWS